MPQRKGALPRTPPRRRSPARGGPPHQSPPSKGPPPARRSSDVSAAARRSGSRAEEEATPSDVAGARQSSPWAPAAKPRPGSGDSGPEAKDQSDALSAHRFRASAAAELPPAFAGTGSDMPAERGAPGRQSFLPDTAAFDAGRDSTSGARPQMSPPEPSAAAMAKIEEARSQGAAQQPIQPLQLQPPPAALPLQQQWTPEQQIEVTRLER